MLNEDKLYNTLKFISCFFIVIFSVLLFPQIQIFLIEFAEKNILGRNLNSLIWKRRIMDFSLLAAISFGTFFAMSSKNIQNLWEKYKKEYMIQGSIVIVSVSIIVRIIMYIKNRTLWLDEAMLAENIVNRSWAELLTPPLSNSQSAPILYVIAVKGIGQVFGYSEFSLRLFSLLSFLAFIYLIYLFFKNVFSYNNNQITFIVLMCALLPMYIWYSNELKPYMSDVLFIVLTFISYFYHKQNKLKLSILTVLYIFFLGFSSPAIFFIGGTMLYEFIAAVINKNKKQIFYIIISGIVILAVFAIYYLWWMSAVAGLMEGGDYWSRPGINIKTAIEILDIFNSKGNTFGFFIWFYVPFAVIGLINLIKHKNTIGCSFAVSLFLLFIASAMGKWPINARLWLFLPAIVLFFTPFGFETFLDKTKYKKIWNNIGLTFSFGMIVFLFINSLFYIGDKAYYPTQEANPLIAYVKENIKEDEFLYVYPGSIPTARYKIGYETKKIGNVTSNNIIFGKNRDEWGENVLGDELRLITEYDKVYLLFSYYTAGNRKIENGLAVLQNYGTLVSIINFHDTLLYYFAKTPE